MTDFDALLKRSFAEAAEPVDDGFTVKIEHAVARRESALKVRNLAQTVGMAAAGAALIYGGYAFYGAFGQEVVASAGLEVARAHGALNSAPSLGDAAQGVLQSLGTGMTQIMLMTAAALAGGAVVYRTTQE
ncbi:MAG TPA: hypothetical protein VEA80_11345 [Vitreimonas sp.]|uniref:hypothetical protein n=1 Tax=Vitreimonas sp. TaxID=3069702 RepID=UPI002D4570F7|nr:hypothetical protein [Vitreimonas sp.]HYD88062.1 hypothetical protein [Vitreimonas sp.]